MSRFGIRQIFERSVDKIKRDTSRILDNDLGMNAAPPYTLYSFTSRLPPVENAKFLARGSDIDIGGYTTNDLVAVPEPGSSDKPSWSHVAFHGNMSLKIPTDKVGKIRAGYAGVRSRKRMTLFGEDCWDLSSHTHLKVEVAYRGWEGWRNRWYCNIQTDSPVRTDLFQHRLDIPPSPSSTTSPSSLNPLTDPIPQFTTLHLPLNAFVLTNHGQTVERQLEMHRGKVRTIGFSLLGGGRGAESVTTFENQASPAQIAEFRRRAQAGYGAGGGREAPDPVVEEMLKQDGYGSSVKQSSTPGSVRAGDPAKAGGYHRVSAEGNVELDEAATEQNAMEEALRAAEEGSTRVTPWSEGYYELDIRSVQAVNYDPMADELD